MIGPARGPDTPEEVRVVEPVDPAPAGGSTWRRINVALVLAGAAAFGALVLFRLFATAADEAPTPPTFLEPVPDASSLDAFPAPALELPPAPAPADRAGPALSIRPLEPDVRRPDEDLDSGTPEARAIVAPDRDPASAPLATLLGSAPMIVSSRAPAGVWLADGSRLGVGDALPGGGRLVAVTLDEIVLRFDESLVRRALLDERRGP